MPLWTQIPTGCTMLWERCNAHVGRLEGAAKFANGQNGPKKWSSKRVSTHKDVTSEAYESRAVPEYVVSQFCKKRGVTTDNDAINVGKSSV